MRALFFAIVALAGCAREAPLVDAGCSGQVELRLAQGVRNKVDLLFVLDTTFPGPLIPDRLPPLLKIFDDLAVVGQPADLQIGVITTDYGAGSTGAPGCQPSPGGQGGKLQALGANASASCRAPVGANFIHYDYANPGGSNLPQGQDLPTTLGCMSAVGNGGCGFEHPLESAYAALHQNLSENVGFVRNNALLVVVFVTDRDDCSAPPDSDLFNKNKSDVYGYESHFRCVRYGVVCGDPPSAPPYGDSGGPLASCRPAPVPPGLLFDVQRYIDFFTRPALTGGVKMNPLDVILVGIDGPDEPVQVILSSPGTPVGTPYTPCAALSQSCLPVVQLTCRNPQQPIFEAEPAVRLNTVIRAAHNHTVTSWCDLDLSGALAQLGNMVVSDLGGGCLPASLPDPAHPDCVVEDVTANLDGTTTVTQLPACGGAFPCWRVEQKPVCASASPQSIGVTIDRNGNPAPDNTEAQVWCLTGC